MTVPDSEQEQLEALWHELLTHGHRTRMAILPGAHRCTMCRIPVGGIGGVLLRPFGRRPSRKNPTYVTCETR